MSNPANLAPVLENRIKLLRFCYLANCENSIVYHRKTKAVEEIEERLSFLIELCVDGTEEYVFKLIEKVMHSPLYSTKTDECIIILAYLVRQSFNLKLREIVYRNAHKLLKSDRELFAFIKNTQLLNKTDRADGQIGKSKGFGRGMRRVISNWYLEKTPAQLVDIFHRHRGFYGWSHKDVIILAHVKFGNDAEKQFIVSAFLNRPYKVLKKTEIDANIVPSTPACGKLMKIIKLKVNEDPNEVAQQLINVGGQLERSHIPVVMYPQATFWMQIINQLSFRMVVNLLFTLHDANLLKFNDELSKKFAMRIVKKETITNSKMQPLELLEIINAYSRNERYQDQRKEIWHTKLRVEKNSLEVNKTLVTKLKFALNCSLNNLPVTGCHFFITLDLRKKNAKRSVFNMKHISCMEAMALFALNYTKKEKASVYAFTDTPNKLNKLEFTTCQNFQEALSRCNKSAVAKTVQSLAAPIRLATDKAPKMFITIMDSVARIHRNGLPSFPEFETYRKKHKKSKYIVLNLARHKQDLHSYPNDGVLEISGLSPETPRIIAAFVTNQFS